MIRYSTEAITELMTWITIVIATGMYSFTIATVFLFHLGTVIGPAFKYL